MVISILKELPYAGHIRADTGCLLRDVKLDYKDAAGNRQIWMNGIGILWDRGPVLGMDQAQTLSLTHCFLLLLMLIVSPLLK
jgi:hypothetical protein